MALGSRLAGLLTRAAKKLLEPAKDPAPAALYGLEQQLQLLRELHASLKHIAIIKQQLELQAKQLQSKALALLQQAGREVALGREERARVALQSRQAILLEVQELDQQISEAEQEEQKWKLVEQRLAARLESYRMRNDLLSARETAAQAQVRVGEIIGGIAGGASELDEALQRVEQNRDQMLARAAAIHELMGSGMLGDLPDPTTGAGAFGRARPVSEEVEQQLHALRNKLPCSRRETNG